MKTYKIFVLLFCLLDFTEFCLGKCYVCPEDVDTTKPKIQKIIIDKHNEMRRLAAASNMLKMEWNDECAKYARIWVETCPEGHDKYENRTTSQFKICGQNLLTIEGDLANWREVIQAWYNEIENFTYDKVAFPGVLHFTQVMWATSYQVGCGYFKCPTTHVYVCNYCPGGNLRSHEVRPFRKGKVPCDECPDHCEDRLCTNPCEKEDSYGDCFHLLRQGFNTCQHPETGPRCNATCDCAGKIHFKPSIFHPDVYKTFIKEID